MNAKTVGHGVCSKHVVHGEGVPLLANLTTGRTVCFECDEEAKPKTGRTVVVTDESGTGIEGTVEVKEVGSTNLQPKPSLTPTTVNNKVVLSFTLEDLEKPNILLVIMQALYDGIDNLPPPPTIKETKKAIAIQEVIQSQIEKLK